MNKIYKIVWNNALQCYTVVSELAKSHSRSSKTKVIGTALFTSLLALSGQATADELPQDGIIDQNITVDSIKVSDIVLPKNCFKDGGKLTVNNGITVDSSTSSSHLYLSHAPYVDESGEYKYDLTGSLIVKGDVNVSNTSTKTKGDAYNHLPQAILELGVDSTIEGNVNINSNAIYNDVYQDADGNEYESRSVGAIIYSYGKSTFKKDLNVDKSYFSVLTRNGMTEDAWTIIDGTGYTQIDGNATFKDQSELNVLGSLNVKGDLSLDKSHVYLSSYIGDEYGDKQVMTDHASIDVGGNLKISGVTDDGSTIYNTVAGDAILNVAGNVDVSGSNSIEIRENSTATIGGDLNLTHVEDTNVWSQVKGNSSLTVNGDLNMKGH